MIRWKKMAFSGPIQYLTLSQIELDNKSKTRFDNQKERMYSVGVRALELRKTCIELPVSL